MARPGKCCLIFLPVLSIFFLLFPASVRCHRCETVKCLIPKDQIRVYEKSTKSLLYAFEYAGSDFGGPRPNEEVQFHISVASPNRNACEPIHSPPKLNNLTHGFWIVVIQRGNCDFEDKVRIAQDAGYHAALIFGVDADGEPVHMAGGDRKITKDIFIPAFFIGKDGGDNLTQKYFQERKNGTLFLTIGDFFPDPVQGLDPVYPLMGVIIFLLIIIFALGAVILCAYKKQSFGRQKNPADIGLLSLSHEST